MLGTALLARATSARVDPLTLKTSATATQGLRAHSARALAQHVLVPKAMEHRVDLGVHGREPLNNSPFFREDRVHRGLRAMHPDELEALVDALEAAAWANPARGGAGTRCVHRRATPKRPCRAHPRAAVGHAAELLAGWVALAEAYVVEAPEGGRRGQALAAAALDVLFADVVTGNVFASSRSLPGDVFARTAAGEQLAVEVKQKPVSENDVSAFVQGLARTGIHSGAYLAIDPRQPELPWDSLVGLALAEGVLLTTFTTVRSFLATVVALAPAGQDFAVRFPERMRVRLRSWRSSADGLERWSALLAE